MEIIDRLPGNSVGVGLRAYPFFVGATCRLPEPVRYDWMTGRPAGRPYGICIIKYFAQAYRQGCTPLTQIN